MRSFWVGTTLSLVVAVAGVGCKKNPDSGGGPGANAPRTNDGYQVVSAEDPLKPKNFDKLQQAAQEPTLTRRPTSPDPEAGDFTLEEATAGMTGQGALVAEIVTDLGTMFCDLYSEPAPNTVANFVGLARGTRTFWDERTAQWTKRAFYDGSSFHRVIPGFMIQGGDALGDGTGGVGYDFADEHPRGHMNHDKAGQLCMANRGVNTNGGQFFITDAAAPHLDMMGSFTIFGQCVQTDVVSRIARVPQEGEPNNRPLTTVNIQHILIKRVPGGAVNAKRTAPEAPPKEAPELDRQFRNAGKSPTELEAADPGAAH